MILVYVLLGFYCKDNQTTNKNPPKQKVQRCLLVRKIER